MQTIRGILSVATLLPALACARIATVEIGTSPNPVGSGARAMGQGNAFIAVADDATAASWNPAGLTQLEKPEVSFAFETIHRQDILSSDRHPESDSSESLSLGDLNYASAVAPLDLGRHLVISLNYLKLYRFDKQLAFPLATSNGFLDVAYEATLDQDGTFAVLAPAIAIDLTPALSLGLTLNIWNHGLTGDSAYNRRETFTGTFSGLVAGTFDQTENERFEVEAGYSLVAGAMWRLSRQWTLAAVLKPSFKLDLDHKTSLAYTQTGDSPGSSFQTSRKTAELEFPWVVGLGAAWRPSDPLTVSMDLTWTQWSDYTFREDGQDANPLTGQASNLDECEDTLTCRLGAEYLLIGKTWVVPLRCGLGYDPAPAVDEVDDFYTLSLGTGLQKGRFMFDIAYEFRWGNHVNGSILRDLDAHENVRQHRLLTSLIVYF